MFGAGDLGQDGKPQPFRWTMLYDVIRQLHATPELLSDAWSRSLDHNHGTASHFVSAMTAVCETFGLQVGDWLRKPPDRSATDMCHVDINFDSPSLDGRVPEKPIPTDNAEQNKRQMEAYERACQQCGAAFSATHDSLTLDPLMGVHGMTEKERHEKQLQLRRSRVATSQYRRLCSNRKVPMGSPIDTIDKVMSGVELPADAGDEPCVSTLGETIPLYTSCILANVVQVSQTYTVSALVQWMSGKAAIGTDQFGSCTQIGARSGLEFRSRPGNGALKYDSAWLTMKERDCNTWKGFARHMVDRTTNNTCNIFDLPQAGLKDLMFLMSTKDNERPCTEEPKMPHLLHASNAFTDTSGNTITETVVQLKMRGFKDGRTGRDLPTSQQVEKPRHPYAKVPDVHMQKNLDFVLNNGRLPAIMSTMSSSVTTTAPLKRSEDGVELNLAAAISHTQLVAESILRCSLHPGCEGEQERFCRNSQGPDALIAKTPVNPADEAAQKSNPKGTKLPYSYDIVPISVTIDAMSRFWDPCAVDYVNMYNDEYGDTLGLNIKIADLPHMAMRFVGMSEKNRRFLSYKVPQERSSQFRYVEAGNDAMDHDNDDEAVALISVGLGYHASDADIERYVQAKQGSRAMSDVRGDLFSFETWFKHTATSLSKRGMVSGLDDPVMQMVQDGPYQIVPRVNELASIEINKIVDSHPDMSADFARPGDEQMSSERRRKAIKERKEDSRRLLYKNIALPPHLDALRYCGPLNIREKSIPITYANAAKLAEAQKSRSAKRASLSVADRFKDARKYRKVATKRPAAEIIACSNNVTVASSSRQDARRR